MKLSKLFFWMKKKQGSLDVSMPSRNLDQKLIKKFQSKLIPNWSQFRYLGNFLNKTEKRILGAALTVFFAAMLTAGLVWFYKNHTLVPASGGEYSEALIGQPKYINPIFSSTNDVDADLVALIYSGLFKYNSEQQLVPELAADYTISTDGKVYDINLRQNIKWSDGEPFTADDVVFTFQTIQDPEIGSPLLAAFQGTQIEQIGDYSVRFTLKEPFAPFLNSLTLGILPQHVWGNLPPSAIRVSKSNLQPIGTGPWKFSKLTNSAGNIQSYTLERNELYYNKFPYLQTLTFKFYIDFTDTASFLKNQNVMAVSFLPNDLTEKIVGKNFDSYQFELPQYTALFFNPDTAPALKDNDFRLALQTALDKNKIVADALAGKGEIINSPILKGAPGYGTVTNTPAFDLEKANQLLNKSWTKIQPEDFFKTQYESSLKAKQNEIDAIKENTSTPPEEIEAKIKKIEDDISESIRQDMSPDQSFYRKNKSNEILSVAITTVDSPEYQLAAEAIAKMWRTIGVKTTILTVNGYQIVQDILRDRNYEVLLYGEIVGADPDPYPFWHSSQIAYPGLNLSLYVNRTVDKLLEDARATTTPAVRAQLYEKFQEILIKEIPAIFLYTPTYNFVADKKIKGITFKQIFSPSDRFSDLGNWYIKTKRQWNGF